MWDVISSTKYQIIQYRIPDDSDRKIVVFSSQ